MLVWVHFQCPWCQSHHNLNIIFFQRSLFLLSSWPKNLERQSLGTILGYTQHVANVLKMSGRVVDFKLLDTSSLLHSVLSVMSMVRFGPLLFGWFVASKLCDWPRCAHGSFGRQPRQHLAKTSQNSGADGALPETLLEFDHVVRFGGTTPDVPQRHVFVFKFDKFIIYFKGSWFWYISGCSCMYTVESGYVDQGLLQDNFTWIHTRIPT